MPEPRLTDWNAGDVLSHDHLQEYVDALRDLFRTHDPSTPVGQLTQPPDPRFLWLLGKVASTGPAGQADYTDERHWVRVHGIAATTLQSSQITLQARYDLPANPNNLEETPVPYTVTATNPSDLAAHSHSLAVDTPVMLVPLYDAQDTPTLHYLIIPSAAAGVDAYNNTTLVTSAQKRLQIPTTGNANNILKFVSGSVSGSSTAALTFNTTGVPDYAVLGVVGGNVVWDAPRVNNII